MKSGQVNAVCTVACTLQVITCSWRPQDMHLAGKQDLSPLNLYPVKVYVCTSTTTCMGTMSTSCQFIQRQIAWGVQFGAKAATKVKTGK